MSESDSTVLSGTAAATGLHASRWHAHSYDHATLYRLAEALGWLPRGARLTLARRFGRLAQRVLHRERAIVRDMLARVTPASDARLDALVRDLFRDFAMCFSDLASTNRGSAGDLS